MLLSRGPLYGYRLRRQQYEAGGQKLRNIEVSVSNTAPGARPERIFIIGEGDWGGFDLSKFEPEGQDFDVVVTRR